MRKKQLKSLIRESIRIQIDHKSIINEVPEDQYLADFNLSDTDEQLGDSS